MQNDYGQGKLFETDTRPIVIGLIISHVNAKLMCLIELMITNESTISFERERKKGVFYVDANCKNNW